MKSKLSFSVAMLAASMATGCIADLSVQAPEAPNACEPEGLEVLLDAFPPCDLGICGDGEAERTRGRCVDTNQVPEGQRELLAACATPYPSLCVPVGMLVYDGRHKPTECVSIAGLEGRCTSECVPQVREQALVLPTEGCADGERCAPCYDPTTGASSGACETSHCDAPNDPQPDFCAWNYDANPIVDLSVLEPCPTSVCDQPSHCMPNALVPEHQRDLLGACDAERKCVPDTLIVSGGNRPAPTCTSIGGAEGRCQSTCIPEVGLQADMLPVDICAATERCAPCYDPVTGESTGACEGLCDAPTEPPYVFGSCCDGRAKCVPSTAVPADQAGDLDQDTCASADELCVPTELTDPTFSPPPCQDFWGNAGACLSTCIGATSLGSTESECPADTKCVLCNVLGFETGACTI